MSHQGERAQVHSSHQRLLPCVELTQASFRISPASAESGRVPEEASQEECLPFLFEDEPGGQEGGSAVPTRSSSIQCAASRIEGIRSLATKNTKQSSARPAYGSRVQSTVDRAPRAADSSSNMDALSRLASGHRPETPASGSNFSSPLARAAKEVRPPVEQNPGRFPSKGN